MQSITYGSICSGVEAASLAWHDLGLAPAWFCEIDAFPSAVLAHRWPSAPNLGDMTLLEDKILQEEVVAPDVVVAGTPCQAFSVAGLRGSLQDARGNLTLVLVRIVNAIDEVRKKHGKGKCTLLWENVPGILNTADNAFGNFLSALAGEEQPLHPSGVKWANAGCVFGPERDLYWRVLDAQYFGVPQRRRRIFVVAGTRESNCGEILFERQGQERNIKPRRTQGENAAAFVESGFGAYRQDNIGGTVKASGGACQGGSETLVLAQGRQAPCTSDKAYTLDCQPSDNGLGAISDGTVYALRASDVHAVATPTMQVRRLTPLECERLQGMPDNHTRIPWRGKPAEDCPDGLRYKAIGNSMAVPVMRWIGKRMVATISAFDLV